MIPYQIQISYHRTLCQSNVEKTLIHALVVRLILIHDLGLI